jgi:hypothetical protein
LLQELVKKHGKHWYKIAEFFPNRSADVLRTKYVYDLSGNFKKGKFSDEETKNLMDTIFEGAEGRVELNKDLFENRLKSQVKKEINRIKTIVYNLIFPRDSFDFKTEKIKSHHPPKKSLKVNKRDQKT